MTSSNGNLFRVTFPAQRPVTRSFDVFFDMRLNKWLSKQWWCWWFETPSRPLWRKMAQYRISLTLESSVQSGPCFNTKRLSYEFRRSHCEYNPRGVCLVSGKNDVSPLVIWNCDCNNNKKIDRQLYICVFVCALIADSLWLSAIGNSCGICSCIFPYSIQMETVQQRKEPWHETLLIN